MAYHWYYTGWHPPRKQVLRHPARPYLDGEDCQGDDPEPRVQRVEVRDVSERVEADNCECTHVGKHQRGAQQREVHHLAVRAGEGEQAVAQLACRATRGGVGKKCSLGLLLRWQTRTRLVNGKRGREEMFDEIIYGRSPIVSSPCLHFSPSVLLPKP